MGRGDPQHRPGPAFATHPAQPRWRRQPGGDAPPPARCLRRPRQHRAQGAVEEARATLSVGGGAGARPAAASRRQARPCTPAEHRLPAAQYVGRHRWALASAGIVSLVLVAALGIVAWQARQAINEAARAQAMQSFVVALFENAGNARHPRRSTCASCCPPACSAATASWRGNPWCARNCSAWSRDCASASATTKRRCNSSNARR